MKARYLIILIAVVLALVIASPVSAGYSISVSGFKDPAVLTRFQSPFKDFSQQDTQSVFTALKEFQPTTQSGGLQGSASAYSNGMYQDGNSEVKFSESFSVTGTIYTFSYSANFNSAKFR